VPPGRTLAELQETAPAAGESQQHQSTGERKGNATPHARKNAGSFFNDASTLTGRETVKDKESLPAHGCAGLIPSVLPIAITASV
jgi:hypothetical protein